MWTTKTRHVLHILFSGLERSAQTTNGADQADFLARRQPTSLPMQEGRKASRGIGRHLFVLPLSILVVIAATITAVGFLVSRYYTKPTCAVGCGSVELFCCPSLLRSLWEASNLTIDPCRNFYGYTCYNWDQREKQSAFSKQMLANVITPTYTGLKRSPAGKTIATYYKSCLNATSGLDSGPDRVVAALLDALKPPQQPTPNEMLHLFLRICIAYEMTPGLHLQVTRTGLFITLTLPEENSALWSTSYNLKHRQQGLMAFSAIMNTNVSWDELKESATRVFLGRKCVCCLQANQSDLTFVFKSGTLQDWDQALRMYTGHGLPLFVRRCTGNTLRLYADAVIDGGHATSLALLTVEASVHLWESLHRQYEANLNMNSLCRTKAESLSVLWDIVVLETLGDPDKDVVVRQVCKAIGEEVVHHAASVFPADDVDIMRKVIAEYKIILASDLHLMDMEVPATGSNYWTNEFAMKDYEQEVRRYQKSRKIPDYEYGTFKRLYRVQRSDIGAIISPSLYPTMIMTPAAGKQINIPVVGSKIAEMYWNLILISGRSYSRRTTSAIYRFLTCNNRRDRFATKRLYVETVFNASRTPNWDQVAYPWGLRKITRSQIIYMHYVLANLCGKSLSGPVQRIVDGVSDFRKAFQCPPYSNDSRVFCSLGA